MAEELNIHSFEGLPVSRQDAVTLVVNMYLIYDIVKIRSSFWRFIIEYDNLEK